LESTLISNPHIEAFYRYDPYSKTMTLETYGHKDMHKLRQEMISKAKHAYSFGIILGTLGRQGNPAIVKRIAQILQCRDKSYFVMLLSEITPAKLKLLPTVDAWVQVACPRLSVDWGQFLSDKPVLSSYEFFVVMGLEEYHEVYPMDYYSHSGGPWTNYYESNKERSVIHLEQEN
jgi:2-(3-amino-3-carboxypropyl)histidine synthase